MFNKDEKIYANGTEFSKKRSIFIDAKSRVGCVIVKNKKILSEGWHVKPGDDHAEIVALKKCKKKSKALQCL